MDDDLARRCAAALAGGSVDDLVDVGCDLADAGRHGEAERCFRRAVDLGAEEVWFDVGNSLREQDRPLEAVAAFERALASGETDAWLNLGAVLEDLGDLAGAGRAFRAAGEVAGQAAGWLRLAHLLREQGEHAGAEDALARAAGDAEAAGLLAAWRYQRTGDPGLEADLRAGAGACGTARVELAFLLRATGRSAEAVDVLERGAKLGQRECWLPLGDLHAGDSPGDPGAEAGPVDEQAAEDAYRAGIAAGDSWCHNNLGVLLAARGDLDGAAEQFRAGALAGDDLAAQALLNLLGEDGA